MERTTMDALASGYVTALALKGICAERAEAWHRKAEQGTNDQLRRYFKDHAAEFEQRSAQAEKRARQIRAEIDRSLGTQTWTCQSCGEVNSYDGGRLPFCDNCGRY